MLGLEEIKQSILAVRPINHYGDTDHSECPFCGQSVNYDTIDMNEIGHLKECLFMLVQVEDKL